MSIKKSLAIGDILIRPRSLTSFSLYDGILAINVLGRIFALEGKDLHHCAIDLAYGQCEKIETAPRSDTAPLQWQVHHIHRESRLPVGGQEIAPFSIAVPQGWLLFETESAWHFWPLEDLLAIVLTPSRLLFVYDDTTLEVRASSKDLRYEFGCWVAAGGVTARHITQRDVNAYSNLTVIDRFHATRIRQRACPAKTALKVKDITGWLPLSDKLPVPPCRRGWEIER